MMDKNTKLILQDDVLVARVLNNQIVVNKFNDIYYFDYKATSESSNIRELLLEYKGKRVCIISSDILNVTNEKIKLKSLERHILVNIANRIIHEYLWYLVTIADSENTELLIQAKFDNSNPSVLITCGLIEDMQVILFEVHYERNERRI